MNVFLNDMRTMVKYATGERVELIKACAWCPRSLYPALSKDQEYTHGVCGKHFLSLMSDLHKKKNGSYIAI